jgi:hypothetical protein
VLVVVLVLENPDCFAIRLTEQISCGTSVSLRSRNPNAPRTSTTTRTIPNFGIWVKLMGKRLSSDSASARSQKQQKEASRRAAPDAPERIPTGAGGSVLPFLRCIPTIQL